MESSEQAGLKRVLAAESLQLFPPSFQETLLEDPDFRTRFGIHADARITLGANGLSFQRSELFGAIRAALGGTVSPPVNTTDGATWNVGIKATDNRRTVTLERGSRKILLPGFLILSPDVEERLAEFDTQARAARLNDSVIEDWRRRIESAPIEDEDVEPVRGELRSSPLKIASALSEELESGETKIAFLAPTLRRYYERLVGPWEGQGTLTAFVETTASAHIRDLIAWQPSEGLKLALLMASHGSFSEVIADQDLSADVLIEVLDWITQAGDRISQVGAVEVGLALLPRHPQIESYLLPIVKQITADDPSTESHLARLCSLIVFVEGELARNRVLVAAPPYWRRLAAIGQAALVERELTAAGAPLDPGFSEWAKQGRGQYFFLQSMIDLRLEPRWLPDFLSPEQLKAEFIGRISNAAQKHAASIQSDELRNVVLGDGDGSLRSLMQFPFPFLPGPLEGGIASLNEMPSDLMADLQEKLQAEALQPNSFAALVNSALVFRLGPDHAVLAATALRRVKYQFRGEGESNLFFNLLSGLATVAAVTRTVELANEVRILTRAVRRRSKVDISADAAMRIGLIAAAACEERGEWCRFSGDWITELAFEDLDSETAAQLHSHIRVLCQLEPDLWPRCAPADAALSSFVRGH